MAFDSPASASQCWDNRRVLHLDLCRAWNGTQGTVEASSPPTEQIPSLHTNTVSFSLSTRCASFPREPSGCIWQKQVHLSMLQEQFLDALHWIGPLCTKTACWPGLSYYTPQILWVIAFWTLGSAYIFPVSPRTLVLDKMESWCGMLWGHRLPTPLSAEEGHFDLF